MTHEENVFKSIADTRAKIGLNASTNSFGFKEKELVNATKDAQTKVPTVDLSNK